MRLRQNSYHFVDNIFKSILWYQNNWFSIWLKFKWIFTDFFSWRSKLKTRNHQRVQVQTSTAPSLKSIKESSHVWNMSIPHCYQSFIVPHLTYPEDFIEIQLFFNNVDNDKQTSKWIRMKTEPLSFGIGNSPALALLLSFRQKAMI